MFFCKTVSVPNPRAHSTVQNSFFRPPKSQHTIEKKNIQNPGRRQLSRVRSVFFLEILFSSTLRWTAPGYGRGQNPAAPSRSSKTKLRKIMINFWNFAERPSGSKWPHRSVPSGMARKRLLKRVFGCHFDAFPKTSQPSGFLWKNRKKTCRFLIKKNLQNFTPSAALTVFGATQKVVKWRPKTNSKRS